MSTTDFTITRDSLIKGALRLCGVLAQGEEPTATQISEAAEALNLMVKAWEADGMPLWAITKTTVSLVNGQADYQLGIGQAINTDKPLKLLQAWNHNITSNVDVPMRIISHQEYNILGSKFSTGSPIQLMFQPFKDYSQITVFPVPSTVEEAQNQIVLLYQRPFYDFDASTDVPDFPQEWYEAVKYGLAVRLAGDYQIDLETRKVIQAEAQQVKEIAKSFGTEEVSMYFGIDRRGF